MFICIYIYISVIVVILRLPEALALFWFCFFIIFRCCPEICKCSFPVLTPSFYHLTIREARLRLPCPDMSWCRLARWGSLGTITSGIVGKNFFSYFFSFPFFLFISGELWENAAHLISRQLCWPYRNIKILNSIYILNRNI